MKRMKARVWRKVATIMVVTVLACLAWPTGKVAAHLPFSDLTGEEPYAEGVLALSEKGVILGKADGTFRPAEPVTRAQLAVFLARTLGLHEEEVPLLYTDVEPGSWYAGAVGALYQLGLVRGTAANLFLPHAPVSRQQAASLIVRALEAASQDGGLAAVNLSLAEEEVEVWLGGFRDRAFVSAEHRAAVACAVRLNILQGDEEGWLGPGFWLTRGQMAMLLYRAFFLPLEPAPVPAPVVPAASSYPELSVGSSGRMVWLLESVLVALHYPCGEVDGLYDRCTRDAVMAFEKVERLPRDGVAGQEVWMRLFAAQTPTPRLSGEGFRVEVDLARQVMFLINENQVVEIIHVSTGKGGTPTGQGKVWLKQRDWVECSVGWMYFPSYFWPRIAIHGSSSVPPYPASHGCVRTPVWIAEHVYDLLGYGTRVDVYY